MRSLHVHPLLAWVFSRCSGLPHNQKCVEFLHQTAGLELELVSGRCTVVAYSFKEEVRVAHNFFFFFALIINLYIIFQVTRC